MNPAHRLFPHITLDAIANELDREAAMRQRVYPGRVETARMTQAEATREIALCDAWRHDAMRLTVGWYTGNALPPPAHDFSWTDRRQGLERELSFRRRIYPDRIATARLSKADADRQVDCLQALAEIYDDGLDWIASNGERPRHHLVQGITPAIEQARREWATHCQRVDARRNPAKQGELLG